MKKAIIIIAIILICIVTYTLPRKAQISESPRPIGGDRDVHGCLGPAGYTWSEEVGVCLRTFEMTPDIMQAAKLAAAYVEPSYGLTLTSFNSYEEPGAYDITFSDSTNKIQKTIYIRNGKVDPTFKPQQ